MCMHLSKEQGEKTTERPLAQVELRVVSEETPPKVYMIHLLSNWGLSCRNRAENL